MGHDALPRPSQEFRSRSQNVFWGGCVLVLAAGFSLRARGVQLSTSGRKLPSIALQLIPRVLPDNHPLPQMRMSAAEEEDCREAGKSMYTVQSTGTSRANGIIVSPFVSHAGSCIEFYDSLNALQMCPTIVSVAVDNICNTRSWPAWRMYA